jgi:hypothetical protein
MTCTPIKTTNELYEKYYFSLELNFLVWFDEKQKNQFSIIIYNKFSLVLQ